MKLLRIITSVMALFMILHYSNAAKPIKVLLVSGGCFHDYAIQTRIIEDSLNRYIYNIDWQTLNLNASCDEIVPLMASKEWGKGYDLVAFNICWAYVTDTAYINNICRIHRDNGINAIVIHCTMHTFRDAKTDEWRKFVGDED